MLGKFSKLKLWESNTNRQSTELQAEPEAEICTIVADDRPEQPAEQPRSKRTEQKNFKMTKACLAAFEAIMAAQGPGVYPADVFEDMVSERYERLKAEGRL